LETAYDWITVLIFAGLIVLFLQRSTDEEPKDNLWHYLAPSAGCALANYVGNEGYAIAAVAIIVSILAYIYYVLKPFQSDDTTSS
jgi:hypothetical protein